MRKLVIFEHVSLDGFSAGPKGEMDWIHVDEEIFDFAADRTDHADIALYGRVTWQMMESYWPTAGDQPDASRHDKHHSAWYKKVDKVVLSRTMKDESRPLTRFIGNDVREEVMKLKSEGSKEIVLFGSPGAARTLMHYDLIDEYWLFVNPVLVGQGIQLFGEIEQRRQLKLVSSHVFKSGVICLNYAKP